MKKVVALFALCAFLTLGVVKTFADDAGKPVTLKGTACCAKCELHQTEKCQTALKVKEDGKDVIYFVKGPGIAHKDICQAAKEDVEVTGVVSEKNGQKWITTTAAEKK